MVEPFVGRGLTEGPREPTMWGVEYEHVCQVCFQPVSEHEDEESWPARCCSGCGCGEEMPSSHDPESRETLQHLLTTEDANLGYGVEANRARSLLWRMMECWDSRVRSS